jgi:cytochrome c oxidase subunit II
VFGPRLNRIPPALGQPVSSTTSMRAASGALRGALRPRWTRGRCGVLLTSMTLAIGLVLTFAPGAFAFFTPQSGGSSNANEIDSLYKITLYIALVIFIAVEGALLYALWKFRARKGAVPAQIHGNTRLEVGWTLGAAVILVVLAVFTFAKLSSIQDPPNSDAAGDRLVGQSGVLYASAERKLPPNGKSLNITVIGRQYIWQYVYPGANNPDGLGAPYSYEEMVVPTNTTVTLDIVSEDVVHSWWVPQLGGKFQAVPGYHNYSWFKVEKPGIYRGQCANLCGRGHARMIATVKAVPPAQFDAWLSEQKKLIAEANAAAKEERAKLNSQTGPGQVENP